MSTGLGEHRQHVGALAETFVAQYLSRTLGWHIWGRNWRCRRGELDIVAWEQETLVIVEVRARSSQRFGQAELAVDLQKARQILRITPWLLREPTLANPATIRFDVVTLRCVAARVARMHHVRSAFDGST